MAASGNKILVKGEIEFSFKNIRIFIGNDEITTRFTAQLLILDLSLKTKPISYDHNHLIPFLKQLNNVIDNHENFNPLFARQMLLLLQDIDESRRPAVVAMASILHHRFLQEPFKRLYSNDNNANLIADKLARLQPSQDTPPTGYLERLRSFYQRNKRAIWIIIGLVLGSLLGPYAASACKIIDLVNATRGAIVLCSTITGLLGAFTGAYATSAPKSPPPPPTSHQTMRGLGVAGPATDGHELKRRAGVTADLERKQPPPVPASIPLDPLGKAIQKLSAELPKLSLVSRTLANRARVPNQDHATIANQCEQVIAILTKANNERKIIQEEMTILREYKNAYDSAYVTGAGKGTDKLNLSTQFTSVISTVEVISSQPRPF